MTTPAALLRAAAVVLPTPAPTTTLSAWNAASEAGLRLVRPLGPRQDDLSAREIAALLIARLAGNTRSEMRARTGRLGRLRSISPVIAAPSHWRQTAALTVGHSFLDLAEALVADAQRGRLDGDQDWIELVELRLVLPSFTAELRAMSSADGFGASYRDEASIQQTERNALGTVRSLDLASILHLADEIKRAAKP